MEKVTDIKLCRKYQQLHDSAKSRGIHFNLTLSHLRKLMNRKTCYYTGIRLTKSGEHFRSIERIDSNKGYTNENTVAVSHRINVAKDNLTEKELKLILKAIQKHKQSMNK